MLRIQNSILQLVSIPLKLPHSLNLNLFQLALSHLPPVVLVLNEMVLVLEKESYKNREDRVRVPPSAEYEESLRPISSVSPQAPIVSYRRIHKEQMQTPTQAAWAKKL